jgi:DNA-binding MarR family transcriptional regulator
VIEIPREPLSTEGREQLADIIVGMQRALLLRIAGELSPGAVSFPQYVLLGHITSLGALSMSEIAESMSHTTAAATGLVDRLVKLGFVRRSVSPDDRRKVLVDITPQGEVLVNRIRHDIFEAVNRVMDHLDPEEQHMWLKIYTTLFEYCRSHAGTKEK